MVLASCFNQAINSPSWRHYYVSLCKLWESVDTSRWSACFFFYFLLLISRNWVQSQSFLQQFCIYLFRLSRTVKLRLCLCLSCPPLFMNTFWCSPFASFTRCCSSCLVFLVVSNPILFLTSASVIRRSYSSWFRTRITCSVSQSVVIIVII